MDWEAFYSRFREADFIAGYEIQNRLGGGAFGEVYKARKHSIGKSYAIKFLKIDDDAQREAVERELDQIRHFAALDHPNLVTIEDLGTAMGVPYLIMGYAGEDTLARLQKRERLGEDRALLYFVQACRGVLALHDLRLVHFDLKPSNVFIKGDVARVGDYGLSKMMTDGRLTLSFGRGTPQYMAPEMLRSRADHRADLYSLGVILYESLSGRLPFEPAVAGTLPVRDDDRPPAFPDEFSPRCRRVVERCLRLSPDDRYPSVADMLLDLGVKARPLDSVLIAGDRGRPPAPPVNLPAPGPRSDARQTARELARGAVEVARGVLDGIRAASQSRAPVRSGAPPTTPPPTPPLTPPPTPRLMPPSAPRSATSLPESLALERGAGEALAMQSLSEGAAARSGAKEPSSRRLFDPQPEVELGPGPNLTAQAAPAQVVTIPVPPPAEGGVWKTAWATVLLAFEVLFSLIKGIGRRAGRTIAGPRTSGARRITGRIVSTALRLLLFLGILAVLGGLATLATIFYISRNIH